MCTINYNVWGTLLLKILPWLIFISVFILLSFKIFKLGKINLSWKLTIFVLFLLLFIFLMAPLYSFYVVDKLSWNIDWQFIDKLRTIKCPPPGYD